MATFPLILYFLVYLEKGFSNSQQIWLVDHSSKFFDLLSQLKDGVWLKAAQGALIQLITYLNFDIPSLNSLFFTAPLFYR